MALLQLSPWIYCDICDYFWISFISSRKWFHWFTLLVDFIIKRVGFSLASVWSVPLLWAELSPNLLVVTESKNPTAFANGCTTHKLAVLHQASSEQVPLVTGPLMVANLLPVTVRQKHSRRVMGGCNHVTCRHCESYLCKWFSKSALGIASGFWTIVNQNQFNIYSRAGRIWMYLSHTHGYKWI